MDRRWILPLSLLGLLVLTWNLCFFVVEEWRQALVIQLGNPMRTVREAGLNYKIPFIQEIVYFDRRLLLYDAAPKEILSRDKQQLVVDNYARWRIIDPLQFYRSVRSEAGARSRLDDIIYSNLRETLGRHTLNDVVSSGRAELMAEITKQCDDQAQAYGIEVLDVRIKRADLPEKNEQNVFSRMRAERERQAKKFRAEGDEEARKIRSEAEKEVQIIMAEARKQGEIIRGAADAQAVTIFAEAYGRDMEFFELQRTLQAYRSAITEDTTLVLSPDAEFFRYLREISPPPRAQ